MRIIAVLTLAAMTLGCGEEFHPRRTLGTRVHSFQVAGVPLTHCSILVRRDRQQEAADALKVCEDEIAAPVPMPLPEPHQGK